jgi:hypothetical protein
MVPSKLIFLLCFVIHCCSSEKSGAQKKFPVPRHILTEVETTTKSSSSIFQSEDLVLKNSTKGLPLISFAEENISKEENNSKEILDFPVDTTASASTTDPESLGLDSNPNGCTQPARCELLPQNATW